MLVKDCNKSVVFAERAGLQLCTKGQGGNENVQARYARDTAYSSAERWPGTFPRCINARVCREHEVLEIVPEKGGKGNSP